MTDTKWMLYGATGYTGRLIAEEAVRRGSRPILAGRDAEKVRCLAEMLGLEWTAFSIEDRRALLDAAESVDLVLNAAGPFSETCIPMMDACLAGRSHYLDISNEIPVFKAAQDRHRHAEARGISIIPGVGFGTVASSSLVRHLCERVSDPVSLEIGMLPYVARTSVGAAKSTLEAIAQGGHVRRRGKLVGIPFGSGIRRIRFPDGERNMIPIPSGDLEAAHMASGIPDIAVYALSPLRPVTARLVLPIARRLLAFDWLRHQVGRWAEHRGVTDKKVASAKPRSLLWGRISGRTGNVLEATLETGEGYAFTAAASVQAVKWVLDRKPAGILTAASFGPDFVLNVGGVWAREPD